MVSSSSTPPMSPLNQHHAFFLYLFRKQTGKQTNKQKKQANKQAKRNWPPGSSDRSQATITSSRLATWQLEYKSSPGQVLLS